MKQTHSLNNRSSRVKGWLSAMKGTVIFRGLVLCGLALATTGCAWFKKEVFIESVNHNSRVSSIVLHHTAVNFETSLKYLTQPSDNPVSSHYLIPEPGDPSYPESRLKIYQLVADHERAWHAGRSYWRGREGLNDQSIGIEIVNIPDCYELGPEGMDLEPHENSEAAVVEQVCFFPDFPGEQMKLVEELLRDLLKRFPHISPLNIVAHSDIAPSRKSDPGPRFPWERLYSMGIGAWYDTETVVKYIKLLKKNELSIKQLQTALHAYGYGIEVTGEMDTQTRHVVTAFQLHFDQASVTGEFTPGTVARLLALLEKYVPPLLPELKPKVLADNH